MHLTLTIEEPEGVYRIRVHSNRKWEMTLTRVDQFERELAAGHIEPDGKVVGCRPYCEYPAQALQHFHRILALVCGEQPKET